MDVEALQMELKNERGLREKAEAAILKLEADIVFTRKDGEDTVKEVKKLRGELEREKYTSATAQQKADAAAAKLSEVEKQLRKSEEEAALAASKLSAKWEEQAAAMSKQIEVAKAAAAELERQLLETEADLATVQAENTQMLEQLQRDALAITELDDEVQVQTGKLEMEKGICSALRTDLDGERASNEAMKSLLEKMERHAEVLKQTLEAVRAELGEAREQTMAAEVHGAEMARAAAAEAKAEAEAAAAECILELEALAREVLGMRRQAEDQMASLAEEGRQICEVAREQLLGLRHDVQRAAALQADLDVEHRRIEECFMLLSCRKVELEQDAYTLQEQRDALVQTIEQLQAQLPLNRSMSLEGVRAQGAKELMAAQDVAERVRQRADGLEADLREANKEIQNLQQQLHAQWQGGAVASSSARESVLELEVEKLRLQVNDYEALLSTDPSGSAPLHRQDSGAAVGLREAALERQIESLKLKLIESEAMQHSLSKASARCGSWGSRMSSNVSTEVLEESLAEFGMYIENLEEAVDHSTLRGQRREGNFCSLRTLYERIRDITSSREEAEAALKEAKDHLEDVSCKREAAERALKEACAALATKDAETKQLRSRLYEVTASVNGRQRVYSASPSPTPRGRHEGEDKHAVVDGVSQLLRCMIPQAGDWIPAKWSPSSATLVLDDTVRSLGVAEPYRNELLRAANSVRSTIQALFDKLQSDLSHYKRLAQANGHDRTRAMSTSPLVENRKREAEAFKQVAQAAQEALKRGPYQFPGLPNGRSCDSPEELPQQQPTVAQAPPIPAVNMRTDTSREEPDAPTVSSQREVRGQDASPPPPQGHDNDEDTDSDDDWIMRRLNQAPRLTGMTMKTSSKPPDTRRANSHGMGAGNQGSLPCYTYNPLAFPGDRDLPQPSPRGVDRSCNNSLTSSRRSNLFLYDSSDSSSGSEDEAGSAQSPGMKRFSLYPTLKLKGGTTR